MKSSEAQVELRDPTGIQVKPGGETSVKQDRSATHENVDTTVNGRAEEAHGVMQIEGERGRTYQNTPIEGEGEQAPAHAQLMAVDEKHSQPTLQDDKDVPRAPLEPPPPSIELKGERKKDPSCEVSPTRGKADALGVSGCIEDARTQPKKLWNRSERTQEGLKRRTQENSPDSPQVEPYDPGDGVDVLTASGSIEDIRKWPKNLQNTSECKHKCSK